MHIHICKYTILIDSWHNAQFCYLTNTEYPNSYHRHNSTLFAPPPFFLPGLGLPSCAELLTGSGQTWFLNQTARTAWISIVCECWCCVQKMSFELMINNNKTSQLWPLPDPFVFSTPDGLFRIIEFNITWKPDKVYMVTGRGHSNPGQGVIYSSELYSPVLVLMIFLCIC